MTVNTVFRIAVFLTACLIPIGGWIENEQVGPALQVMGFLVAFPTFVFLWARDEARTDRFHY